MVFTDPRYLPFLLLVLALYWSFSGDRSRKVCLLIASYAFYSAWDWRFTGLLLVSTVVDYFVALLIAGAPDAARKRRYLVVSIVVNLGILGFFKYYNFFVDSAVALLHRSGLEAVEPAMRVLLPPGVSFYTFMSLGYTIDVYRGDTPPRKSFLDYAVFVSFFPHLVAGPILRAPDFLKQLDQPRDWKRDVSVRWALGLILLGYFKKACVADQLAPVIDDVFNRPDAFSTADNWLALALYHVQIYCDFSGYTDIALGSAGMLGYRLCPNFDFPYFATNVGRFWRRWHMSLSTWLKDYLYIPLGGSRRGAVRTTFNLYVTLILCGLWHGAGWKYVLFGFIHATYVCAVLWYGRLVPERHPVARVLHALGTPLMTLALLLSWIVFRAVDWEHCGTMFRVVLGFASGHGQDLSNVWWLVFAALALVHWLAYRGVLAALVRRVESLGSAAWPIAYGASWALVLTAAATHYQPFLYFQF